MKFQWSTIGHDSVKHYFEKLIASETFRSHGFLFTGTEHVGKTTLVNDVVLLMLCMDKGDRPCGICQHCSHMAKNTHPDVYRVKKTDEAKHSTVEDVRSVLEQLQSSSFFRSKKVCIIEEADTLSNGAANALLKTLEEPAGQTFFFFITAREESLPTTIRSRCQKVQLYPLGRRAVYEYLISKKALPPTARELAQYAGGKLGLVLPWIRDEVGWKKHKDFLADKWKTLFSSGYGKSQWYAKKELLPFNLAVQFSQDLLVQTFGINEYRRFPWIAETPKTNDKTHLVGLLEAAIEAVRLDTMNVSPKMIIDSIHAQVRNMV